VTEKSKKKIIVISVEENTSKPVFAFGRAYKRVGKTNQRLGQNEIRKLSLQSANVSWDRQICKDATLKDLDWDYITESFIPRYGQISQKEITGKSKDLLQALHLIKEDQPTNAGILLLGKHPLHFFSHSYIALARYKGVAVGGEKLDYKEFTNNLFQQIDKCNKYIIEHTALMSRLHPGEVQRKDISEYGRFSVRELITNAVCHRDYEDQHGKIIIKMFDDRIEFYNIGGLPDGISKDNITSQQFSRNPVIANVLAKLKYIEELGEGWDKIIDEHKHHVLNPEMPAIEATAKSVLVTLFSTKERFEQDDKQIETDRQKQIIEYLKNNDRITTSLCAKLLDISADTALRELSTLCSHGIISRKGVGRGTYYILS
jgi:ATP-dependent DNA helicase RecG